MVKKIRCIGFEGICFKFVSVNAIHRLCRQCYCRLWYSQTDKFRGTQVGGYSKSTEWFLATVKTAKGIFHVKTRYHGDV